MVCADFGANVGGFTDCLLQRKAEKVYAVDTGYGELAWTLRNDPRVVVMERTNALHCEPPELVNLVTIDMAWTPQVLAVPAAGKWLAPGGRIISLLKTHYERTKLPNAPRAAKGRCKRLANLSPEQAVDVCVHVCQQLALHGYRVANVIPSPIQGKGGGQEYLMLVLPER